MDHEVESEITLEESLPDIARLIRVDCTPFCDGCDTEDGKTTVNGKCVYDILYESDSGKLKCHTSVRKFSASVAIPKQELSDVSSDAEVACKKISCKLQSPRKATLKASLGIHISTVGCQTLEAVAVTEESDLFFDKKVIGFDGKRQVIQKDFEFSETCRLAQGEKNIGEIVFGSLRLQSPQTTLSPGNATLKSNLTARILYEDEDREGEYVMSTKTFPVELQLDHPAIEDFKTLSFTHAVTGTQLEPQLDEYGESRCIAIKFGIQLKATVCEPAAHTVACDLFSTTHHHSSEETETTLERVAAREEKSFGFESKLPPSEPGIKEILSCVARDCGTTCTMTDSGLQAEGSVVATVLASTDEGIFSFDHVLPFSQTLTVDRAENYSKITATMGDIDAIPTLHTDGSISAKMICNLCIRCYSRYTEKFISNTTQQKERDNHDDDCSMIFCFPDKNDTRWSLAKKYYVNPNELSDANPNYFGEGGEILKKGIPLMIRKIR